MRLKLLTLTVLTVLTGAFLICAGIAQASGPTHVRPNTHSAVYHRPHVNPTRIA
jgi:uncharacterized membrane protein HdeD (DUF308 family)